MFFRAAIILAVILGGVDRADGFEQHRHGARRSSRSAETDDTEAVIKKPIGPRQALGRSIAAFTLTTGAGAALFAAGCYGIGSASWGDNSEAVMSIIGVTGGFALFTGGVSFGAASGMLAAGKTRPTRGFAGTRLIMALVGIPILTVGLANAANGNLTPTTGALPTGGSMLVGGAFFWGLAEVIRTPYVVRRIHGENRPSRHTAKKTIHVSWTPMISKKVTGASLEMIW